MSAGTFHSRWTAQLAAMLAALACFVGVAHAQTAPSPFTSATRYDAAGRVTGTISPDPDGAGPLPHLATRTTYDLAGRPVKVEQGTLAAWQSEAVAPAAWPGFAADRTVEAAFDPLDRKIAEWTYGATGGLQSLTQYKYDVGGRLECTAVRMNPAAYGSLPTSACVLGAEGTAGPDRITRNVYDAAGQLLQIREGVGTAVEAAEATYSYTANGKKALVIDAGGNRAELRYDGHDRQVRWVFPAATGPTAWNDANPDTALASAGALNEEDYEEYGYDANGNRTSLRKRDGALFAFQYDALNRMTLKSVPERAGLAATHTRDVFYAYDLRGLQTEARFDSASGEGTTTQYDGFGRIQSAALAMDGANRTLLSQYDPNGNRTALTHPDGMAFAHAYDGLNRPATIGIGGGAQLIWHGYSADGSRWGSGRTGLVSGYKWDKIGRLAKLTMSVTADNGMANSYTYAYNPASQLASVTRSNDAFAWTGHVNVDRPYSANGLNQYTQAGSAAFCYDANGNLTADGSSVFRYDAENRLVEKRAQANTDCAALSYAGALQASLRYDPAGRLYETIGPSSGTTRFLYDGDSLVGEYGFTGALLRRYVHGSDGAADDPLFWFEGNAVTGTAQRMLVADHQGSIVAVGLPDYTLLAINTYDEYGIPASTNQGRFQYTGQAWLPELGMYHYKARIYSPTLGRFLQVDPIGYDDQVNLYAYVGNDPINGVDPEGKWIVPVVRGLIWLGQKCAGNATCRGAVVKAGQGIKRGAERAIERVIRRDPSPPPQKDKPGVAGGERAGKPFTPKGKREVTAERTRETGGNPSCVDCERDTNDPVRTGRGERRDPLERNVDHIIDRSEGGDGSPENGAIRCFECNIKKPPRSPGDKVE